MKRSGENRIKTKKKHSWYCNYSALKFIECSKINWLLRKKNYFYNLQIPCYKENSTS